MVETSGGTCGMKRTFNRVGHDPEKQDRAPEAFAYPSLTMKRRRRQSVL